MDTTNAGKETSVLQLPLGFEICFEDNPLDLRHICRRYNPTTNSHWTNFIINIHGKIRLVTTTLIGADCQMRGQPCLTGYVGPNQRGICKEHAELTSKTHLTNSDPTEVLKKQHSIELHNAVVGNCLKY